MQGSKTLTVSELVKKSPIDISHATLRRAIHDGRLPAELVFRKFRVTQDDFERFLREPRKGSAAR